MNIHYILINLPATSGALRVTLSKQTPVGSLRTPYILPRRIHHCPLRNGQPQFHLNVAPNLRVWNDLFLFQIPNNDAASFTFSFSGTFKI